LIIKSNISNNIMEIVLWKRTGINKVPTEFNLVQFTETGVR